MSEHLVVVGAGQMGAGIAQVAAMSGRTVTLIDLGAPVLERAHGVITQSLERLARKNALGGESPEVILDRIALSEEKSAYSRADFVIEAVSERLDLKQALLFEADAAAPEHCVLASNTSSISITVLAAATKRPDRVVGMHFMNPVPVMKLVEVIRGQRTGEDATRRVVELARALGKTPVEAADYPGFVSNRLLMPFINEAVFALMEGVARAEAIDTVMTLGMNHPMGPLALADFIGLDTCLAIMEVLHEGLGDDKYRPCPLLRRYVAAGLLGRKSGQGFYEYSRVVGAR